MPEEKLKNVDIPVARTDGQLTVLEAEDPDIEPDAGPGQLAIAAAHNAVLVKQGCKLPAQAVLMRKQQIIGMWDNGTINVQSYLRLALQYEMDMRAIAANEAGKPLTPIKFDSTRLSKFVRDWRGPVDPEKETCKELKLSQILAAIAKFAEKDEFKIDGLEFHLEP